jgi:hypothetical protein
MEDFKFSPAFVDDLSFGKEGQEKQILTVSLVVAGNVEADTIDDLICSGFGTTGQARRAYWGDNGDPRFPVLEPMKIQRVFKGITVEMLEMTVEDSSISKCKFTPRNNHTAFLEMKVKLTNPPHKVVGLLSEMLKSNINMDFSMPQSDIFDDNEGESAL